MTLFMRRLLMYGVALEIVLFFLFYYFGSNGTHVVSKLILEKEQIMQEIVNLEHAVDELYDNINQSHSDFIKEKIARERLRMKKKDETIYFLKK